MLNQLTEMINKKFDLTGADLEIAVLIVGAALAETMAISKRTKQGMTQTDCYTAANHFQTRLYNIRDRAKNE